MRLSAEIGVERIEYQSSLRVFTIVRPTRQRLCPLVVTARPCTCSGRAVVTEGEQDYSSLGGASDSTTPLGGSMTSPSSR